MSRTIEAMGEALERFLQSPPAGTPAEVIEAFDPFRRPSGMSLSPHLFYELVEQAPVSVAITDESANILYVNRAFENLTEYSRDELIGRNQSILSNRITPKPVYESLWATISDKRSWTGKLLNRKKGGEAYLAEVTISPVLNRDGDVSNYLGMHSDVTEVHQLQQQIRHHKVLFEQVLDAAPVVMAFIDSRGRVILDNQEYKKLIGDLPGLHPATLLVDAIEQQADLRLRGPGSKQRDFHNVTVRLDQFQNGEPRWFSCSGTWLDEPARSVDSFYDESETPTKALILIAADITLQRRNAERARLQDLRASLAEQRLRRGMREAMTAAIYHMRKPINVINAASALVQRSQVDAASLLAVLEQIAHAAETAIETLHTVLPVENREPRSTINLNELLQEVLQLSTEELLGAGIVVEWRPDWRLPAVSARSGELRAAFKYLVENAVKAIVEGRSAERSVLVSTRADEESIEVLIQDSGCGLREELGQSVFDPFQSGWSLPGGHAGMGLTIAREIINLHGGDLRMSTPGGGGCRVTIDLPLTG